MVHMGVSDTRQQVTRIMCVDLKKSISLT